MSIALRICRAYTKKKLSSLKILSMQILQIMSENEKENAEERSDKDNVSDSL